METIITVLSGIGIIIIGIVVMAIIAFLLPFLPYIFAAVVIIAIIFEFVRNVIGF